MEELYKALDKLVEKNIIIDYELSDDFGNGWIDMYLKLEEEEQWLLKNVNFVVVQMTKVLL